MRTVIDVLDDGGLAQPDFPQHQFDVTVGSPITSCQRFTGTWLVISSDPRSQRSFDDLEQIAALLGIERFRAPIVDDQQAESRCSCNGDQWQGMRIPVIVIGHSSRR
jgi:hypothetical protein